MSSSARCASMVAPSPSSSRALSQYFASSGSFRHSRIVDSGIPVASETATLDDSSAAMTVVTRVRFVYRRLVVIAASP